MRYRLRTKRALLAAALLLAVAACSNSSQPSASPDLVPIALATSQPIGPGDGCPAALLSGTLVAHREWGIAAMVGPGAVERIVWPHGYYGLEVDGRLALISESNRVVALVGDRIEAGGGYAPYGADDLFHVCGSLQVVAP